MAGVTWAQAVSAGAAAFQAAVTATAAVVAYRAYRVNRGASVAGRVGRLDVGLDVDVARVGAFDVLRVCASAHNRATAPVVVDGGVPPLVSVHALSGADLDPAATASLADSERWAPEHVAGWARVLATGPMPAGVTVRDTVLISIDREPATVAYRVELSLKLDDVGGYAPDTWLALTYAGLPRGPAGLPPSSQG